MTGPAATGFCRLIFERGLEWNDDAASRPNSVVVTPLPVRIADIIDHFSACSAFAQ